MTNGGLRPFSFRGEQSAEELPRAPCRWKVEGLREPSLAASADQGSEHHTGEVQAAARTAGQFTVSPQGRLPESVSSPATGSGYVPCDSFWANVEVAGLSF